MKTVFALLLAATTLVASADPAVKYIQVNIHNYTRHTIELKKFDASRLFEGVRFAQENIDAFSSVNKAVVFSSFDKDPMTAGIDVMINDEPMKLMWQVNMGYDEPDAPKFHICGVIKDNDLKVQQEYCYIPYVEDETLFVDFNIE